MKTKILVVSHRESIFPKEEIYTPILVGNKEVSEIKLTDKTGDNIAYKNSNYCELTALYWLWKNCDDYDYTGLCHYRRYFNFKDEKTSIYEKDLERYVSETKNQIEKDLEKYDIILPNISTIRHSIEEGYKKEHIEKDWEVLMEVIKEKYPEYYDEKDKVFSNNKFYSCNMFITNKRIFTEYMEWMFDILFEVEKRIEISKDSYQARVFGFMSERMLNLYVYKRNLNVKEYPALFIKENQTLGQKIMREIKRIIKNS